MCNTLYHYRFWLFITLLLLLWFAAPVTALAETSGELNDTAEFSQVLAELSKANIVPEARQALLIPVLAILFIFGGPIAVVLVLIVLYYRAKTRRGRQQSENIARLLEAGREVPVELLRGDEPEGTHGNQSLRKGMTNLGLGIGLLICLTLLDDFSTGSIGFIFIGLGLAQLTIWKLVDEKTHQEPMKIQESEQA